MSFEPVPRWVIRCDGTTTAGRCSTVLGDQPVYLCSDPEDQDTSDLEEMADGGYPVVLDSTKLTRDLIRALLDAGWITTRENPRRHFCPEHVAALARLAQARRDGLPFDDPDPTPPSEPLTAADQGTPVTRRPQIVTVCGSMRFFPLMLDWAAAETAAGVIVLAPFVTVLPQDQDGAHAELKARLDALHRDKIDLSDRVAVVTDHTGYIGDSTRAEIAYAHQRGIPVDVIAWHRHADDVDGSAR